MTLPPFKSFQSTVTPLHSRRVPQNFNILVDPNTGAPAGLQNQNANGADGIWTPIDLTAAQIASPTALMLADLNAVYRLIDAPHTRFYSSGTALVPFSGSGTVNDLAQLAITARAENPWSLPVMASAPTITVSASADATLTNTVIWSDTDASVFNFYGGTPTDDNSSGYAKFPCVTVQGSYVPNLWGVEFVADAVKVQIKFLSTAITMRFIINGQYVSLTPLTVATGAKYVMLDFTSAGGRQIRAIRIEVGGGDFHDVSVGPTEGLTRPNGVPMRLAVIGDSFTSSGNVSFLGNLYEFIMGANLGIRDVWNLGVAGTAFTGANPGELTYIQRMSDLVAAIPSDPAIPFAVAVTGWHNDTGASAPAAGLSAAVTAWLTLARSSIPATTPIFFIGISQGNLSLSASQLTEAVVQAAVTSFNDPLVYFVPGTNVTAGPWMTGTGSTAAPTGSGNCDVYISSDTVHPNDAGHFYLANVATDDFTRIVLQTTGIRNGALSLGSGTSGAVPTDGYGIQGPHGLFGTMVVYSPLIVDTYPGISVRGTVSVRNLPA